MVHVKLQDGSEHDGLVAWLYFVTALPVILATLIVVLVYFVAILLRIIYLLSFYGLKWIWGQVVRIFNGA